MHAHGTHRTEVAIVGGGLAGLTLAQELSQYKEVTVLERGGSEDLIQHPSCDEGYTTGLNYPFSETRDYRLGGSTSIWAGYCAEFDTHDFISRPWLPLNGWPFPADELAPFRKAACKLLNLGHSSFDPFNITNNAVSPLPTDVGGLTITAWRFGEPTLRILKHWRESLENKQNLNILINTRVVEIRLSHDHSSVDSVVCYTSDGHLFNVYADTFILALGGLETARVLLASNNQVPDGIGNNYGMVGRCFCEHPHLEVDGFTLRPDHPLVAWAEKGSDSEQRPFAFCMGVPSEQQIKNQLLNARAHIFRTPKMSIDETPRLGIFLEQAPSPESRITLSTLKDNIGVPHINLHWSLSKVDKHSAVETANYISRELEKMGAGEVKKWAHMKDITPNRVLHSNHQLGTTRMSIEPSQGVVDVNSQVHGLDNLYISGGSVFPTVSWANPSFTVLLMTLRLAAHLKSRLNKLNQESIS